MNSWGVKNKVIKAAAVAFFVWVICNKFPHLLEQQNQTHQQLWYIQMSFIRSEIRTTLVDCSLLMLHEWYGFMITLSYIVLSVQAT